eukprot:CAMPEP_0173057984 /NCGR_PEP_ID=MMETSP1102-20130122/1086_1 /TAXON_ID=49646 /ORGANISM="Geminigera sp., Strain Caron Lab Isolate" /LENGTH=44 /DNA_ID= /DNA_START= /DNA_END= /DNA_ORIENTATION=
MIRGALAAQKYVSAAKDRIDCQVSPVLLRSQDDPTAKSHESQNT